MPKLSKLFPSEYLQSADLNGKQVQVRIDKVVLEEVGQKKDWKPVIYFQKAKKAMVLNVTNARMIESAYGDDTDDWHGKLVGLTVEKVPFQGKIVDGLRIYIPTGKQLNAPPPPEFDEEPPFPEDDDSPEQLDDEINPFD
jgi:hypothetical protein